MSGSFDFDLVCIGSGPAGQRAAVQAAKLGWRAAVVEKRRAIARGQIIGDHGGMLKMLLVHVGQAVLGLGGGLDYFLHTVFNYPTLAECYKVAALDASNKLRF